MITVALVEDEPLLRQLLSEGLAASGRVRVRGAFSDGSAALKYSSVSHIDVGILDIDLGLPPDGLEVAASWRARNPDMGIVFLTNLRDPAVLLSLPELGREGTVYMHKRSAASKSQVMRAIDVAARGDVMIDPVFTESTPVVSHSLDALTPHQQRILKGIARGDSNRRIALDLDLSLKSVENATTNALRALGIDGQDADINVRVVAALTYLRLVTGSFIRR
jgi:DNA-binding NarL/FixJ family response regulator